MEKYNKRANTVARFLSVYRDPAHNRSVGGATNSQHVYGNAMDPSSDQNYSTARALNHFSGLGTRTSNRNALRHADVRHLGPNTTGGTPTHPTVWLYAS